MVHAIAMKGVMMKQVLSGTVLKIAEAVFVGMVFVKMVKHATPAHQIVEVVVETAFATGSGEKFAQIVFLIVVLVSALIQTEE